MAPEPPENPTSWTPSDTKATSFRHHSRPGEASGPEPPANPAPEPQQTAPESQRAVATLPPSPDSCPFLAGTTRVRYAPSNHKHPLTSRGRGLEARRPGYENGQ